jgi:reverse gyrase
MEGKDVILQAQTGSGKTLAYALPILSKIDATRASIQAVIVVPTRELGLQVTSVLKQLSAQSPNKVMIMSVVDGSKNRRFFFFFLKNRTFFFFIYIRTQLLIIFNIYALEIYRFSLLFLYIIFLCFFNILLCKLY